MAAKCVVLFLIQVASFWNAFSASPAVANAMASQLPSEPGIGEPPQITIVNCGNQPPFKSRKTSSEWLSSPDDRHHAKTEVSAEAKNNSSWCLNQSTLLVSNSATAAPKVVFTQGATELQTGNTLRLVDWAADGNALAFELVRWQYGSDAPADYDVLVYDLRSGSVVTPKLDDTFRDIPQDCLVEIHGLGFTPEGRLVVQVSVSPYYDPDESEPRNRSCPNQRRIWAVNVETAQVEPLPADFQVRKYGKTR